MFLELIEKEKEVEPFVYGNWVYKINTKGGKDLRYFAVTYVQIYLCKQTVLGHSLKISRNYPLVDLKSISSDRRKNTITFVFASAQMTIESEAFDVISRFLANLFFELFPEDFTRSFDIQLKSPFTPPAKIPQLFISLFASFSKSFEFSLNFDFIKELKRELKQNQHLIDFCELPLNKKSVYCLLSALELTKNIKLLKICESKYFPLFQALTRIVTTNKFIGTLTICGVRSENNYDHFIIALNNSTVVNLRFESSKLSTNAITKLAYCDQAKVFQKISFVSCSIDEKKLNILVKFFERFTALKEFELCNSHNAITHSHMSSLTTALSKSSLTTIVLRNTNLNILEFLMSLSGRESRIESIDVSENMFSSVINPTNKKEVEIILPASLKNLKMTDVSWAADALLHMLVKQKYASNCSIDISNVSFVDSKYSRLFSKIENSTPVDESFTGLTWRENELDPRLIVFLAKNKRLERIDISKCDYKNENSVPILNSLVVLIHELNITHFSFAGSKQRSNTQIINELLLVLQSNQTIKTLDISENYIGDTGLEVLQRCIESSSGLKSISFDMSHPTSLEQYSALLRSIIANQSIVYVATPTVDIKLLRQANPQGAESLVSLWNTIIEACKVHDSMGGKDDDDGDKLSALSSSMTTNALKSEDEELTTSWEVDFPKQKESVNQKEWKAMSERYTLANVFEMYNK